MHTVRHIESSEDMIAAGVELASRLRGGDIIELIGDVGAGKTTLTTGIAAGLGISEDIQSPTFTISRIYEAPDDLVLAHYDFYRLSDAGIMADELTESLHDSQTITVIEWGDIVADVLPAKRTTIRISATGENKRQLEITSPSKL